MAASMLAAGAPACGSVRSGVEPANKDSAQQLWPLCATDAKRQRRHPEKRLTAPYFEAVPQQKPTLRVKHLIVGSYPLGDLFLGILTKQHGNLYARLQLLAILPVFIRCEKARLLHTKALPHTPYHFLKHSLPHSLSSPNPKAFMPCKRQAVVRCGLHIWLL